VIRRGGKSLEPVLVPKWQLIGEKQVREGYKLRVYVDETKRVGLTVMGPDGREVPTRGEGTPFFRLLAVLTPPYTLSDAMEELILSSAKATFELSEELALELKKCLHQLSLKKWLLDRDALYVHLTDIERVEFFGRRVKCEAQVSGIGETYAVPKRIRVSCRPKGDGCESCVLHRDSQTIEVGSDDPILIAAVSAHQLQLVALLKKYAGEKLGVEGCISNLQVEVEERAALKHLRVRPAVTAIYEQKGIAVDEKGREFKPYDVYALNAEFETAIKVTLEGLVIPDPRSQRVTMLVTRVENAEGDIRAYRVNRSLLQALYPERLVDVESRVNWLLKNFERYAKIVGRGDVALACILAETSPYLIVFEGKLQRGWLIVVIIGDTTTAKSETAKAVLRLFKRGIYITGECARLTGLVGALYQLSSGVWLIDWGMMVLADRSLLVVDGANKISLREWGEIQEAERNGVITKLGASRGKAQARTRAIHIANPEAYYGLERRSVPMRDLFVKAQALEFLRDKPGIARLDIAVFTSSDDVPIEAINNPPDEPPEFNEEAFRELALFVHSREPHQILFTQEALKAIYEGASMLYKEFSTSSIPLVNEEMKLKLARLSASLATLTLSVDEEFEKVVVKEEHVNYILEFIKRVYRDAGLHILRQREDEERLDPQACAEIWKQLKTTIEKLDEIELRQFILYVASRSKPSIEELCTRFSIGREIVQVIGKVLEAHGFLKREGGWRTTGKFAQFARWLREGVGVGGVVGLKTDPLPTPFKQSSNPAEEAYDAPTPIERGEGVCSKTAYSDDSDANKPLATSGKASESKQPNTKPPQTTQSETSSSSRLAVNNQSENPKARFRCVTCGCGPWLDPKYAKEHRQLYPTHIVEGLGTLLQPQKSNQGECLY